MSRPIAGAPAPDFSAKDQHGNTHTLSDYKGKKLVIFFYPEDDTPTCTTEACNLRDGYGELTKAGYSVLGVSPQDEKSHKKFAEKYSLPYPLLADPDLTMANAFGVWAEKQMFGHKYMGILRNTFLIDENGVVEKVIAKVQSANHTAQILKK